MMELELIGKSLDPSQAEYEFRIFQTQRFAVGVFILPKLTVLKIILYSIPMDNSSVKQ